MTLVFIRIFMFTLLPLLMAGALVRLDKSSNSRQRRLELFLLFLFSLGVAGNGIGNFFGHFFISDLVAESIGWPAGSPFQLEVGFANLALGVLGVIAVGRRDGFREATVIAVTIFAVGATIVHIIDIIETANLAPGNTWQNVINLIRPVLLISFLAAARRSERDPASLEQDSTFDAWRQPRAMVAGRATGIVATGFGVGFAIDQPVIATAIAVLVASLVTASVISRSQT